VQLILKNLVLLTLFLLCVCDDIVIYITLCLDVCAVSAGLGPYSYMWLQLLNHVCVPYFTIHIFLVVYP